MHRVNHFLIASGLALFLVGCGGDAPVALASQVAEPDATLAPPSIPMQDAPALAKLGTYAVGTTTETVEIDASVRLTPTAERFVEETRALSVRVWYPALQSTLARGVNYQRQLPLFDGSVVDIALPGIANENAPPVSDEQFPLVIVSHGFGGWATSITNLTENLASKGYVVVAIDHADLPSDPNAGPFAFPNVVIHRAHDQRAVIRAMTSDKTDATINFRALIDREHVGLIGYSMGGFGALATIGATYDENGESLQRLNLPAPARDQLLAHEDLGVDAAVLLAPWGAQQGVRAWQPEALAAVDTPVLLIGGDLDDVSMYEDGIRWLFERLTGSPRYLLTYQMARHNVANNPLHDYVPRLSERFQTIEYFGEPVWRTDRINAINQHFVTAFFDGLLKDDDSHAAFLNVPTERAVDGDWPLGFGQSAGGNLAGEQQPDYWPGFQRRWAVGLRLETATVEPSP
ncbi:MAG: dienelactone hydrolase family protein [Pseudomonadota bacterium]